MATFNPTENTVWTTDDYYGYRFPVPSGFASNIMATVDERMAAIEKIGVFATTDEELSHPLLCWINAVREINGIEPDATLDLGFTSSYVRHWTFYLA